MDAWRSTPGRGPNARGPDVGRTGRALRLIRSSTSWPANPTAPGPPLAWRPERGARTERGALTASRHELDELRCPLRDQTVNPHPPSVKVFQGAT